MRATISMLLRASATALNALAHSLMTMAIGRFSEGVRGFRLVMAADIDPKGLVNLRVVFPGSQEHKGFTDSFVTTVAARPKMIQNTAARPGRLGIPLLVNVFARKGTP